MLGPQGEKENAPFSANALPILLQVFSPCGLASAPSGWPSSRPARLASFSTKWGRWPDEVGSDGVWPAGTRDQNKAKISARCELSIRFS